jgi:hypothetical protein
MASEARVSDQDADELPGRGQDPRLVLNQTIGRLAFQITDGIHGPRRRGIETDLNALAAALLAIVLPSALRPEPTPAQPPVGADLDRLLRAVDAIEAAWLVVGVGPGIQSLANELLDARSSLKTGAREHSRQAAMGDSPEDNDAADEAAKEVMRGYTTPEHWADFRIASLRLCLRENRLVMTGAHLRGLVRYLDRARHHVVAEAAKLDAARREGSWAQTPSPPVVVPWENAGGPNECAHGYAAGVWCRDCAGAPDFGDRLVNPACLRHGSLVGPEDFPGSDFEAPTPPSCSCDVRAP